MWPDFKFSVRTLRTVRRTSAFPVWILVIWIVIVASLAEPSSILNKRSKRFAALTGTEAHDAHHDCTEALLLTEDRSRHLLELEHSLNTITNLTCEWVVAGTDACRPTITCSNFKLSPDCKEEYLEITDGSVGKETFCANSGPKNIVPRNNLKELYINLKTTKTFQARTLKCTASCADAQGRPLAKKELTKSRSTCKCGKLFNQNRIVNGETSKLGEFPWLVALVSEKTRRPFCGGTLLNDRFVLTAAHCFKGAYANKENIHVLANAFELDVTMATGPNEEPASQAFEGDAREGSIRRKIEKYYHHPLYVRQTNDFDVAVIKLDAAIDLRASRGSISPACIAEIGDYTPFWEGESAVVAGWGLTHADARQTAPILQKLNMSIFSHGDCRSMLKSKFNNRMLCAGYKEGGKDACKGDSGGPLVYSGKLKKRQHELIGVVSWGDSCALANSPGVYAKFSEMNQWIRYIVNREGGIWCYR